jgi:hypothetical protein
LFVFFFPQSANLQANLEHCTKALKPVMKLMHTLFDADSLLPADLVWSNNGGLDRNELQAMPNLRKLIDVVGARQGFKPRGKATDDGTKKTTWFS